MVLRVDLAPGMKRGRQRPDEGVMSTEATVLRGNKPLNHAGAMLAGLMAFLGHLHRERRAERYPRHFGTPLDQIAWVSTAYAMANITVIPISDGC